MADSSLDNAIAAWQTLVGAGLTGLKAYPENPTELMTSLPAAITYPGAGVYVGESATFGHMVHTIITEIHVSRNLLPKAIEQAKGYIESLVRLAMNNPKLSGTVDTIIFSPSADGGALRYTFGRLVWGEIDGAPVENIGLRFEFDVKITITGTG